MLLVRINEIIPKRLPQYQIADIRQQDIKALNLWLNFFDPLFDSRTCLFNLKLSTVWSFLAPFSAKKAMSNSPSFSQLKYRWKPSSDRLFCISRSFRPNSKSFIHSGAMYRAKGSSVSVPATSASMNAIS